MTLRQRFLKQETKITKHKRTIGLNLKNYQNKNSTNKNLPKKTTKKLEEKKIFPHSGLPLICQYLTSR